jgi:hypothetical protein
MAGRLSGIFLSKALKPRTMIVASLVGCLAASIILVIWGASSAIGVYIGTCMCHDFNNIAVATGKGVGVGVGPGRDPPGIWQYSWPFFRTTHPVFLLI